MKLATIPLIAFFCSAIILPAHAGDEIQPIAIVNGVKIEQDLFNQLLASNVAQGIKDTPELRAVLKRELVTREVLAQEAKIQKIDQDPRNKAQLHMQQNALLAELLITKQAEKFNITEEKLRAEYKRQLDLLADVEEYQVSHIVTTTEDEAKVIIKLARDGQVFEKLAREKSISTTRSNGGSLGWMLPNQINPILANVVVNLSVGSVATLPIATPEGWQVIHLDDKRKFKAPGFEESRQQLINAVFANERAEYVQKIIKTAKIQD